jgi:hypothetical protein
MADLLGLGGGIEKIEEYLGKRITGAFIVLTVLAVSAVCMKAIWDNLVQPIAAFLQTPVWGQSLLSYVWVAGTVMLGVAGGLHIAASITRWKHVRQIKSTLAEARAVLKEAREGTGEILAETDRIHDRAMEVLKSTRGDVEAVADLKRRTVAVMGLALVHARSALAADQSLGEEERAAKVAALDEYEMAMKEAEKEGEDDDEHHDDPFQPPTEGDGIGGRA